MHFKGASELGPEADRSEEGRGQDCGGFVS